MNTNSNEWTMASSPPPEGLEVTAADCINPCCPASFDGGAWKRADGSAIVYPVMLWRYKEPEQPPAQAEPMKCKTCNGVGLAGRFHDEECQDCGGTGFEKARAKPAMSPTFHERMGITLLDAKWLDPECWTGCQSLKWKNEAAKAQRERDEALSELAKARDFIASLQS